MVETFYLFFNIFLKVKAAEHADIVGQAASYTCEASAFLSQTGFVGYWGLLTPANSDLTSSHFRISLLSDSVYAKWGLWETDTGYWDMGKAFPMKKVWWFHRWLVSLDFPPFFNWFYVDYNWFRKLHVIFFICIRFDSKKQPRHLDRFIFDNIHTDCFWFRIWLSSHFGFFEQFFSVTNLKFS